MANKYITEEVFKKSVSDIMQTMADNTYEFEPYDDETIASAFELSPEEQRSLSQVINDEYVAKNKVFSNEYTLELLEKTKAECNQYAVEQLANSGNLKRKIVSSDSEVIDENILYLILTDSTNNIYTQYMLIDGTATPLGNTQIDLSDYLLIDDFNTTIADYAKKTEVVSQNDVVNDLTTVSSSTVLSSQGTSNELDKKIDKTSIATTIDSTSTDEQVVSAKLLYDEFKNQYLETISDCNDDLENNKVYMVVPSTLNKQEKVNYGLLVNYRFFSGDSATGDWRRQILFPSSSEGYKDIYVRLKTNDTDWSNWYNICITAVSNVVPTSITSFDSAVFNGEVNYEVKNGICYTVLSSFSSTSIGNSIDLCDFITPRMLQTAPIVSDATGEIIGLVYISGAKLKVHIYKSNIVGFASFSYPVAES